MNTNTNNIPGDIYLCQIGETVSCGACCGLYNVTNPSREALTEMLTYRTEIFEKIPREMDAILSFQAEIESRENQKRPYPEFHHCPFIGLIGDRRSRVGCLLHPLAKENHGVDFRGLSYYGGMACNGYFCPTYCHLPKVYKEILRDVSEDWYLHGLIVTETKMLAAFFQEIEARLGHPLTKADILNSKERKDIVREFLSLKRDWAFRPPNTPLGNYFFKDNLYPKTYKIPLQLSLRYNTILQELGSVFETSDELYKAETILNQLFERLM